MDNAKTIEELAQKVADLQYQLNDREQEVITLRADVNELREATSTLSTWMEKLAETVGGWLKKK
jgi:hypothetical protein